MARYENFIIENKVADYLDTKLAMSKFLTVDKSLVATPGMIINVHKYTKSGSAETVTEGNGNTASLAITYANTPYTVTTTQARVVFTDEAEMADPYYVEKNIESLAESIMNQYNAAAVAQFESTTNTVTLDTDDLFGNFADAIAELNVEDADEKGFFALVNPAMKATLRKGLADELKYVEDYARIGYVGSICGIPVYVSKDVSDDTIIIANSQAVTCFMKKDVEVEQDRNIDTRTTTVVGRNVKVIALTDESKCVVIK